MAEPRKLEVPCRQVVLCASKLGGDLAPSFEESLEKPGSKQARGFVRDRAGERVDD